MGNLDNITFPSYRIYSKPLNKRVPMFFKTPIKYIFCTAMVSLMVSGCKPPVNSVDIEVVGGPEEAASLATAEGTTEGLADGFGADVRKEPLPEEFAATLLAYADGVIADLYKEDAQALRGKTHTDFTAMFDSPKSDEAMELLDSETADLSKKEFLGYNIFQTDEDLFFASLFYRVPFNGGHDNITLNVDPDLSDCCRLMGFKVEKSVK